MDSAPGEIFSVPVLAMLTWLGIGLIRGVRVEKNNITQLIHNFPRDRGSPEKQVSAKEDKSKTQKPARSPQDYVKW